MVRLRREIEGVRRNHAVPLPGYALDEEATGLVLPQLDRWLLSRTPGRILLAGAPRQALAEELARRGHWVTVSDLDEDAVRTWHASLAPQIAAQLTWMTKAYGDISFGPAVFDCIVLTDALAGYCDPQWVVAKAVRELKPDGELALRAWIQGAIPSAWRDAPDPPPASRWIGALLPRTAHILRSPFAAALVDATAQEAIDRGAHLDAGRFAMEASALAALCGPPLDAVVVWLGDSRRTAACEQMLGARPTWRRVLRKLVATLPESMGSGDGAEGPRCAGWVGRRSLGGGLRFS